MARHNEHSISFLQLTDLLHVLQVTLPGTRQDKLKKKEKKRKKTTKRKEENVMIKLVKALLPPIC